VSGETAGDPSALVRFEGPEQGLPLLVHALRQAGLVVTGIDKASLDPTPTAEVACIFVRVVAAEDSDTGLVDRVRSVLDSFAGRYHRAGLDVVGQAEGGPDRTADP
jgi:hypothetical protein